MSWKTFSKKRHFWVTPRVARAESNNEKSFFMPSHDDAKAVSSVRQKQIVDEGVGRFYSTIAWLWNICCRAAFKLGSPWRTMDASKRGELLYK